MKTLRQLREETNGETRMLWHSNYWDGPLSGLMLWNGEKSWFEKVDERCEITPWTQEEINEWVEYKKSKGEKNDLTEEDYVEYDRYYIYKVYRVQPELLEHLEDNHRLFQEYVGTHCDYDKNGCRHHNLRPSDQHSKFYNREKPVNTCAPPLDKSAENVIGEFEL